MELEYIKSEIRNKNYSNAIRLMNSASDEIKNAEYYLLRGICLQVANPEGFDVVETEFSLKKAVELDPKNKDAKLELAYFLLNVKHDPTSAKRFFLDILKATRDEVPESIASIMESSQELRETYSSFANTLKEQADIALSNEKPN